LGAGLGAALPGGNDYSGPIGKDSFMNTGIQIFFRKLRLLGALLLGIGAAQGQSLAPNPAAAGLWAGEVTLQQVTHARGGTNAPTMDQAQMRILLHVSANGAVRLLKDVTIAQRTGSNPGVVLVTNPALLPGLSGVVRRGGKLVGRRLAAAGYDFAGNELSLAGGIGQNFRCEGTLTLAADHPTNPFHHRYHPEHASGFEIRRAIALRFTQPISNLNGMDQLAGEYEETISGLHKATLTTKGIVALNRLSPVGLLNQ